jgi:hypothetical protein
VPAHAARSAPVHAACPAHEPPRQLASSRVFAPCLPSARPRSCRLGPCCPALRRQATSALLCQPPNARATPLPPAPLLHSARAHAYSRRAHSGAAARWPSHPLPAAAARSTCATSASDPPLPVPAPAAARPTPAEPPPLAWSRLLPRLPARHAWAQSSRPHAPTPGPPYRAAPPPLRARAEPRALARVCAEPRRRPRSVPRWLARSRPPACVGLVGERVDGRERKNRCSRQ